MKKALTMLLVASVAWTSVAWSHDDDAFSAAELDQMLAPIALYPDVLLSQILIAATYPLEVIEAHRWSRRNPGLEGEDAVNAVADRDWDPSVKALVAFPQLLERMSDDLGWTTRLGEAYLYQEQDVVDAIRALRDRAYATGHLQSTEDVRVYREREVIYIEPVRPRVVYVPWYHPAVVYGPWWWSAHPPVYWGPPPRLHTRVSFYWGRPVYVAPTFYYSAFDWHRRHIVVFNVHYWGHPGRAHPGRGAPPPRSRGGFQGSLAQHLQQHEHSRWQHDARRRHAGYRHPELQARYGQRTGARTGGRSTSGPAAGTSAATRPSPTERHRAGGFTGRIEQRLERGDVRPEGRRARLEQALQSRDAPAVGGTGRGERGRDRAAGADRARSVEPGRVGDTDRTRSAEWGRDRTGDPGASRSAQRGERQPQREQQPARAAWANRISAQAGRSDAGEARRAAPPQRSYSAGRSAPARAASAEQRPPVQASSPPRQSTGRQSAAPHATPPDDGRARPSAAAAEQPRGEGRGRGFQRALTDRMEHAR
jgi:hypothetical protein